MFNFLRQEPRFFMILSHPRSGSFYLRGLLASHLRIACHAEIFHHELVGLFLRWVSKRDTLFNIDWRNQHPEQFIERMLAKTQATTLFVKHIGCKMLMNDYQMRHGLEALLKFKPLVLLLTRKNRLAWYSSMQIAGQTGVWVAENVPATQRQITFNPHEYLQSVIEIEQFEASAVQQLKKHDITYLPLDYDDLANASTQQTILDFLGVSQKQLSPKTYRQNSEQLLNRFHNPQEVEAFAMETGVLEWL